MTEAVYRRGLALAAVRDGLISFRGGSIRESLWLCRDGAPEDLRALAAVPWERNSFTALLEHRHVFFGASPLRSGASPVALTAKGHAELSLIAVPHSTRQLRARRAA